MGGWQRPTASFETPRPELVRVDYLASGQTRFNLIWDKPVNPDQWVSNGPPYPFDVAAVGYPGLQITSLSANDDWTTWYLVLAPGMLPGQSFTLARNAVPLPVTWTTRVCTWP